MARSEKHRWGFRARFRRNAFGWRSQPAMQRIKEAVSEIKAVGRGDPVLAAEGAVLFLERVAPALERVDSSSGAIGMAVNRAIDELVPVIAEAPADERTRRKWLERLLQALRDDEMPYIEHLGDRWGELCATPEIASEQADGLLEDARAAVAPGYTPGVFYSGASACLSALFAAGRFDELVELASGEKVHWSYKRWAVRALAEQGRRAEALRLAEASRGPYSSDLQIDRLGEEILLSSGMAEEAYRRYGLSANRAGTYLATFRAVRKRYPEKDARTVLADLAETTPGEEGKWFAAAKSAGLLEEALELARSSPCDPRTLTRAARDFAEKQPEFAVGAGLLALYWLHEGFGYEITSADVWAAHDATLAAATRMGAEEEVVGRIRQMVDTDGPAQSFVRQILGRALGLE